MNYVLKNGTLTAMISSHGAELKSLVKNGHEYIWQADPNFWARSTPVLFPLVGSLKDKQYKSHQMTFHMGQHGFARDAEFTLVAQNDTSVTLRLESDETTAQVYPYAFVLEITHTLLPDGLRTTWRVINPGTKEMSFAIGGHPGFNCETTGWSLALHNIHELEYHLLSGDGIIGPKKYHLELTDGLLPITQELFKDDALIIPEIASLCVGLVNASGKEVLQVHFDTSILGLWTPAGKNAPFVCIEPWYGTADWYDADGVWEHRKYMNVLAPGEIFEEGYTIKICE